MAGARIHLDNADVVAGLTAAVAGLDSPGPLYQEIIEYLHVIHRQRFQAQQAPDGTPWAPLSPRYQQRKHRNKGRILALRGYLAGTLRGQIDDDGLEFGTDRAYGAIHQLGGTIERQGRSSEVFFRRDRDGTVGNRFVRPRQSNFAQRVSIGPYKIIIPSRKWLGTNEEQNNHILAIASRYIANNLGDR